MSAKRRDEEAEVLDTIVEDVEDVTPEVQAKLIPLMGVIRQTEPIERGQYSTIALNDIIFDGERLNKKTGKIQEYKIPGTVWCQWQASGFNHRLDIRDMVAEHTNSKVALLVEKTHSTNHNGDEFTNFEIHSLKPVSGPSKSTPVSLIGAENIK